MVAVITSNPLAIFMITLVMRRIVRVLTALLFRLIAAFAFGVRATAARQFLPMRLRGRRISHTLNRALMISAAANDGMRQDAEDGE